MCLCLKFEDYGTSIFKHQKNFIKQIFNRVEKLQPQAKSNLQFVFIHPGAKKDLYIFKELQKPKQNKRTIGDRNHIWPAKPKISAIWVC